MPSTVFTNSPTLAKAAVKVVRKWQGIPADIDDDTALAQGIISPELLELVMQILTDMITNCFDSNSSFLAWRRIKGHFESKKIERLSNNMLLNSTINKWLFNLGVSRDRGDIVALRESLVLSAQESNEQEFAQIQQEVLSWTLI
jgi:hypothetical protein